MKKKEFRSIIHNPGYDFLRELEHINEENKKGKPPKTSKYFGSVLGVIFACFGIEGYINFVGTRVNASWEAKIKGFEPIRSKIGRLFSTQGKTISFQKGIFKEVLDLFVWRKNLVHPVYLREEKNQGKDIQDIFDETEKLYPIERSLLIANEFRNKILKEFNVSDRWQTKGKNIPVKILEMDI